MPYINSGREVVVIMHSYSGGPGAMAAKGLSVAERQATGKLGGVIGLIFVSAWIAQEGETFTTGSGGRLSPWVIENVSTYYHNLRAFPVLASHTAPMLTGPLPSPTAKRACAIQKRSSTTTYPSQ